MDQGNTEMIETKILNYLKTKLNMTNIFLETPKTIPSEFIVFQVVNRSRSNLIDDVTVEFYSYSTSKYNSCLLDQQVRAAMYDFADEIDISASRLGGGNDSPDTTLKKYRYRCYFNITYMEE